MSDSQSSVEINLIYTKLLNGWCVFKNVDGDMVFESDNAAKSHVDPESFCYIDIPAITINEHLSIAVYIHKAINRGWKVLCVNNSFSLFKFIINSKCVLMSGKHISDSINERW